MAEKQKSKKKKVVKICVITIIIVVLVVPLIAIGVILSSVLGVLPPKDLGVTYSEQDYSTAMDKLNITFADTIDPDEPLDFSKVKIETGESVRQVQELTSSEVTAVVNSMMSDIAENQQVKISENNKVAYSGTVKLQEALDYLKIDIGDVAVVSDIEKVNLVMEAELCVSGDKLAVKPESIQLGMLEELSKIIFDEIASGGGEIELPIDAFEVGTVDDKITLDAVLPESITITEKTAEDLLPQSSELPTGESEATASPEPIE